MLGMIYLLQKVLPITWRQFKRKSNRSAQLFIFSCLWEERARINSCSSWLAARRAVSSHLPVALSPLAPD